jgi:hypothetical protein
MALWQCQFQGSKCPIRNSSLYISTLEYETTTQLSGATARIKEHFMYTDRIAPIYSKCRRTYLRQAGSLYS